MAVNTVKNPPPPAPKPPAPKPPAPKPPAPTDPKAAKAGVSLAATGDTPASPASPTSPTSPTGKKTIDYSGLQKPQTDPNAPAPVRNAVPLSAEDAAKANNLYGQLIGQMNNLSSVNRSQAAAITGKDFSNIKAETTEAAFVPQVQSFLTNIIDDGKRVEALGKDGQTYLSEMKATSQALADLAPERNLKGYSYSDVLDAITPSNKGLMKSATEELANSTATLAAAGKTYGDRLDSKANELLGAWDTSKHTEQKQEIVNGIMTAFSLLANVGIGGNAIVQLAVKDAAKMTEGVGEAWNAVGLRGGQLTNLFGAITAADLQGFASSTPGATAATLDSSATAGHQHLQDLANRFQKYVDDYNNQTPPDPNPFVIV